jgi:hypothetical protein
MLRPTVSRPVCLGIKHAPEAYSQTIAGLLMWDALSDKRTGLSFTIAAGPRQRSNFRGTVFYCLRLETSIFVASYDPQGYGGGIGSRLHTDLESSLCSPGADPTENTAPKSSFVIVS